MAPASKAGGGKSKGAGGGGGSGGGGTTNTQSGGTQRTIQTRSSRAGLQVCFLQVIRSISYLCSFQSDVYTVI